MKKFYNSKWFIPTIVIIYMVIATSIVYFLFDHFHLWGTLIILICLWLFIKIVAVIMKILFSL